MPEARRDVFQALADPTRRAILSVLMGGALSSNALAAHFDASRQAISKHAKILTECGLLKAEISGRELHYKLQPKRLKEVDKWLQPFRAQWESRFAQLDELLQKPKNK